MAKSIPPDESMPRNRLPVAINFIKYHLWWRYSTDHTPPPPKKKPECWTNSLTKHPSRGANRHSLLHRRGSSGAASGGTLPACLTAPRCWTESLPLSPPPPLPHRHPEREGKLVVILCTEFCCSCILYSVLNILYSVFCILYSVFCILYFCILYSLFSNLYCMLWVLCGFQGPHPFSMALPFPIPRPLYRII